VDIAQVQDRIVITDNVIDGNFVNAGIYSPAIFTNALVARNIVRNRQTGDHAIEFSAAGTGQLVDNRLIGDTLGTILDPGSMMCLGNLEVDAINQSGVPTPRTAAGAAPAGWLTGEQYVAKTDGAVLNGADPLFTVAGGPIMIIEFVGIVTTIIGGAANMTIQETTTAPAGTTVFSTTVAIDADAVGTSYTFTAASPSVLTPTTAGAIPNVPRLGWLAPIGTIQALGSAAQTGVIAWYMTYKPLSADSVVVAAT